MSLPLEDPATGIVSAVRTVQALHAAIQEAALSQAITLPSRVIASAGGAVYDCEMVAVSALSAEEGLAGDVGVWSDRCDAPVTLVFEAAIVRCAHEKPAGPRGNLPPEPEWILTDLEAADADADILLTAARELDARQLQISFNGPNGGMISTVLTGRISLT